MAHSSLPEALDDPVYAQDSMVMLEKHLTKGAVIITPVPFSGNIFRISR